MNDGGAKRRLEAGELLFSEGETGHEAYLIESGTVQIFLQRPDGCPVLANLGPDELFGEMALVGDQTRSASARAVTPAVLSVITHETLDDHVQRASPLLRHLLHVTLARCRDTLRLVDGRTPALSSVPPAARTGDPADRDLAVRRLRLEQALTEALQTDALLPYFQPIVRLAHGEICGFEALVRWRREDGRIAPPGEFIWVLEDSALIGEFGRQVLRSAAAGLRQLAAVHRQTSVDGDPLYCSVNLSVRQFADPELFPAIEHALSTHALAPSQLRLEITESAALNNFDAALQLLGRCRDLGCKLVVDDFGTGYSSLAYLHRLPVHGLKLDHTFVHGATSSERGLRIVRAVGRLAEDLEMDVVAEGIETPEQAALCQDMGLACGQGYFFGRPLPLDGAIELLRKR